MKKLFLALLAVASVATANAQKNTFLLYGNAGVNTGKTDNGAAVGTETETAWNVSPGFGYQFNHHLTVGVQGGYNAWKNEVVNTPSATSTIKNTATAREWQAGVFLIVLEDTDVPPGSIFAGVPAKKVKDISQELLQGEVERIANNYLMYSSWFK